jgi:AraC family transcriptional regulator
MLLKEFPDIEWLQKQAGNNFSDGKGIQGMKLPDKGWPSVVMHTRSSGTERRDIAGPFSVFTNMEGKSNIRTEGLEFLIQEDTYCITNKGQHYDLVVSERSDTLTFNVHFGEKLFSETAYALQYPDKSLVDQPFSTRDGTYRTYPRTVWKDKHFQWWIDRLHTFYHNQDKFAVPVENESENLSAFLEYILLCDNKELKAMQSIPSLKPSTRAELMKRVLRAIEFIHDRYTTRVTLDDLSEVSSLSKFHLQRTFRQVKGCTPQQYIARLRLSKSRELMENSEMPLSDIALLTGFSELPSFSRFFLQHEKMYPSRYREKLASPVK